HLEGHLRAGRELYAEDVEQALKVLGRGGGAVALTELSQSQVLTHSRGSVVAKSLAQKHYVEAIRTHDIVFGIGPAGTGKTYLAIDRKSTRLNSSHVKISYAVF